MKLYFINHSCLFAVEQMMMTLFPGERPVYPEEPDQLTSKRALQRIVRLSFYDAGVQAWARSLPGER